MKERCNRLGCNGELGKINLITPLKMQGKCKECGKHSFFKRKVNVIHDGIQWLRSTPFG